MATLKVTDRVGERVNERVGELSNLAGDLGGYLKEQRESARLSLRQLATAAGVSNPYLSQIERGLRKPSAEVLQQIAKGLQISAEALFLRAGILEDSEGVQVEVAIASDVNLTARQKRVLLDIYATFRAENARDGVTPGSTGQEPTPEATEPVTVTQAGEGTGGEAAATPAPGRAAAPRTARKVASKAASKASPKKAASKADTTGDTKDRPKARKAARPAGQSTTRTPKAP